MFSSFVSDPMSAEPGPSRPRLDQFDSAHSSDPPTKLKKRRRLQFTSQIRNSVQRYNPDGTETVEYLHQQSTQRLKRKWDSIFERFKDAHLQEQDEIYLGNRANGEPIVVVKDRGSLRSLRQDMEFGVFIKDEELQGWKDRPEARGMRDDEDEFEEDFDPSHMPVHQRQFMGASSSESEEEEEDPAANDPDLREFLQAEAQRRALLGKGGEDAQEAGEDEDVIDFSDPTWANQQPSRSVFIPSSNTATSTKRPSKPSSALTLPQPDLAASSSEDEDDTDVVTIHSDSDEELIDSIHTKRQNIEELLQCTTPFETLPYNDIFGLADLLKITDNSSRLYVDLVSDDEEEIVPQQASAEDASPAAPAATKEDVIDLTSSLPNTVIDITSSLPNTVIDISSSLPNSSSNVVDVVSSPVSSRVASRASSLEPAAPGSERSMTPDEDSSAIALIETPRRDAAAMLPSSSIPSLRSTQPSQPVPGVTDPSTPPLPSQTAALVPSTPVAVAVTSPSPQRTAVPSSPSVSQARPSSPSVAEARPSSPLPVAPATRASPAPAPASAAQTARATATPTPPPAAAEPLPPRSISPVPPALADPSEAAIESEPSRSTAARTTPPKAHKSHSAIKSASPTPTSSTRMPTSTSAPSPSSSTPSHDRHTSSHRKHSHRSEDRHRHRRSSHSKRHDYDALDAGAEKVRKKKKCGGPGKCKKTFCLDCASLTRS